MNKRYSPQWLHSISDNLKSKTCGERSRTIQNPKWCWGFALAVAFAMCGAAALAQQTKKVPRICYLGGSSASISAFLVKPFRERLREIGYVEGQNLTIEFRYSEGKEKHLPELAAELVRLNCDVIVTAGGGGARAAKNATKTIPVVMAFGPDAVRLGIVADLARPGGNITGLTDMGAQLYG